MNKEDYKIAYENVMIANKMLEKEIERQKEIIRQLDIKNLELTTIIKEAREYITSQKLHKLQDTTGGLTYQEIKLLEILDKEEE